MKLDDCLHSGSCHLHCHLTGRINCASSMNKMLAAVWSRRKSNFHSWKYTGVQPWGDVECVCPANKTALERNDQLNPCARIDKINSSMPLGLDIPQVFVVAQGWGVTFAVRNTKCELCERETQGSYGRFSGGLRLTWAVFGRSEPLCCRREGQRDLLSDSPGDNNNFYIVFHYEVIVDCTF